MANKMQVTCRLEGLADLMGQLEGLKQSVQNKILRPAVTKAAAPILGTMKSLVKSQSTDTGLLEKSLGAKIKTYPSGVVVAILGSRREFKKDRKTGMMKRVWKRTKAQSEGKAAKRIPVYYAHLVEYGFKDRSGKTVRARSFMRAALEARKKEAEAIMAREIQEGLKKAWGGRFT